jgi:2-polyprenyl-3-methyl-5-hydroxy-6-metoxy-1,4-benzoquinol methylase
MKLCPLCGGRGQATRTLRQITLARCDHCGFVYTALSDQEILEANASFGDGDVYEQIQTRLDRAWFHWIAEWLARRDAARVLDVGCGNGLLIEELQRVGIEADGLDPSPWARAAAARLGFRLHVGRVEDERLPAQTYDAVTSTSTFEHIPDPVRHVHHLLRLVRPDGTLYITGMPNYGSVAVRLGLSSFHHNNPPFHANFFTPRTLRAVFARPEVAAYVGSLRVRTYGVPEAHRLYNLAVARRRRSSATTPGKSTGSQQGALAGLYYAAGAPFGLGDKLEVVATKASVPTRFGSSAL